MGYSKYEFSKRTGKIKNINVDKVEELKCSRI